MKRKSKAGGASDKSKSPKLKKRRSVVLEPIHISPKYLEDKFKTEFKKGFESKSINKKFKSDILQFL